MPLFFGFFRLSSYFFWTLSRKWTVNRVCIFVWYKWFLLWVIWQYIQREHDQFQLCCALQGTEKTVVSFSILHGPVLASCEAHSILKALSLILAKMTGKHINIQIKSFCFCFCRYCLHWSLLFVPYLLLLSNFCYLFHNHYYPVTFGQTKWCLDNSATPRQSLYSMTETRHLLKTQYGRYHNTVHGTLFMYGSLVYGLSTQSKISFVGDIYRDIKKSTQSYAAEHLIRPGLVSSFLSGCLQHMGP